MWCTGDAIYSIEMDILATNHRSCEICGIRERYSDERLFFARFPSNEDRCKEWVKVAGKEDLIYLPVKKLHSLRYICGRHFKKRDFTKSKSRLKRSAVPSVAVSESPLPDCMLENFPIPMATDVNENASTLTSETQPEELQQTQTADPPDNVEPEMFSWQKLNAIPLTEAVEHEECAGLTGEVTCSDDEVTLYHTDNEESSVKHQCVCCNGCMSDIVGFRYKCVQCADYDLCAACEARGEHADHYMLRIPGARPHAEIQRVVNKVREELEPPTVPDVDVLAVKEEIKEEVPQEVEDVDRIQLVNVEDIISSEDTGTLEHANYQLLQEDFEEVETEPPAKRLRVHEAGPRIEDLLSREPPLPTDRDVTETVHHTQFQSRVSDRWTDSAQLKNRPKILVRLKDADEDLSC